jgi:hypothetical protein
MVVLWMGIRVGAGCARRSTGDSVRRAVLPSFRGCKVAADEGSGAKHGQIVRRDADGRNLVRLAGTGDRPPSHDVGLAWKSTTTTWPPGSSMRFMSAMKPAN